MKKIGFSTEESLNGSDTTKSFENVLRTDGVALEFLCSRPRPNVRAEIIPASIQQSIDIQNTTIWGVDPIVSDLFAASDDCNTRHRIRR